MKLYGALEAGGTKMMLAVVNEKGELLEKASVPTGTPAETMPQMISFFRKEPIAALGISCFGPLDLNPCSETYGRITATPKLAWRNYPILSAFREALHIPAGLDTDVRWARPGDWTAACTLPSAPESAAA